VNRTVLSVFGLNPTRIGGTESYARELSAQLARHGWASVLCFEAPPPVRVRQYLDLPNVSLEVVPNVWRQAWRPARDLARVLQRHRPSILHLQFTGFLSVYPWLARLHGVKKVFMTDQASRPEGHVIRRAPAWKRAVARAVNHPLTGLISISEFNRRCIVQGGLLPEDRVVRIYNAVDLGRRVESKERGAEFRRRHGIRDGRAVILQVSQIIPEKGVGDLLDAARTVLERDPNVHFVLVGEGRARPEYMQRAEAMGIGDHVSWTGLVTDPFGEGLYGAADVVCQMSRWEEGFGWVIAEAMVHERPVVGTRVGAIPEIVRDGVTGLLVNRGDSAAMADSLLRLIRDPELRRRLGAAGRALAEAEFDLRSCAAQVLQLYGISGNR
jgi:glycosyltransferase involved in cell wall biosynthesis